ncbi:uncharacterized protein LOC131637282 [Vicia villosa]|uniref:uncharacterized protein LOC131637282 n=1 Tax=Vicia villosa TaxID=3911 RepID=UPI00273AE813|nr:uncharacterized protein LOC131637282 [Vicia villosa]
MNKVDKSQVKVLSFLAFLLVITHFLPSSLRPTYLYLIFNILIIALAAQAGLLSAFSEPSQDTKHHVFVSFTQQHAMQEPKEKEASCINSVNSISEEQKVKKVVCVGESKVDKVKRCPSMPSLFYIGDDEEDDLEVNKKEEVEGEDEICGVNGQELFAKAEAFIGNFYKQLKMQREESCAS